MKLEAFLTVGWGDDPQAVFGASRLHNVARNSKDYLKGLAEELDKAPPNTVISGLENLFRRRRKAFLPLRQFIGALTSLPAPKALSEPVVCRIDVFAYAFLKMAKNLDFLVPRRLDGTDELSSVRTAWAEAILALEDFERTGEPLPAGIGITARRYLSLRDIISRSAARDELRSLVVLLTSGPSTLSEISIDLGLNHTLGQRTLSAYQQIGILETRPGGVLSIENKALPLVVFCLREKIGIDLLPAVTQKNACDGY